MMMNMMKKIVLTVFLAAAVMIGFGQAQPMRFMGIGMNSTLSTFISKLKGKGFTEDVNRSKPNYTVMKGVFAGERVRLEVRSAAKTHLVYSVNVYFNLSTQFTYEDLKARLSDKYGTEFQEFNKLKEENYMVKYTTDYSRWQVNVDTLTQEHNAVILTKCSYNSNAPLVITYVDGKNAKVEDLEINSDF